MQLDEIFDSYTKNSLFKNKSVLQANHIPETLKHREKQIESMASILAPCLRLERVSNVFIYGKTGTGKTVSIQYLKDELLKKARKNNVPVVIEYINCKLKKVADTEYRILAELIRKLGGKIAETGLPTETVYNKFIELL